MGMRSGDGCTSYIPSIYLQVLSIEPAWSFAQLSFPSLRHTKKKIEIRTVYISTLLNVKKVLNYIDDGNASVLNKPKLHLEDIQLPFDDPMVLQQDITFLLI